MDTKLQIPEQVAESIAVDQVNGWSPITGSLSLRIIRDGARGELYQPLVRSTNHRAAEVANGAWADRALVALALKQYLKRQEGNAEHPLPVDATIAATASDRDLDEFLLPVAGVAPASRRVRCHGTQGRE